MASLCVSCATYAWLARLQRPVVFVLRCGFKGIKMARAVRPHFEDRREVSAAVAVVGRGPHGAEAVVVQDAVPLHAQLVCAQNVRHLVHLEEVLHDRRAKRVARATRRDGKLLLVRVRVGPHEVGHRSLVRDLAEAVDDLDLVNVVDRRREAAVQADDLVVDHDRQGEKVKHVGKVLPYVRLRVLAHALGIETVRLCHRAALVVAAHELHAARVPELEAGQERNRLYREQPAVHIVAQKQVVGIRRIAADAKDFQQIVELAG